MRARQTAVSAAVGACQGQYDGAWGRRGGRGEAGFLVKLARRPAGLCWTIEHGGAQTASSRRTHWAHPTLLLFGPDHRTAARVGNAREGGSPGDEA